MASDVGGLIRIWRYETIVKVVRIPSRGSRLWVLVQPVLGCQRKFNHTKYSGGDKLTPSAPAYVFPPATIEEICPCALATARRVDPVAKVEKSIVTECEVISR